MAKYRKISERLTLLVVVLAGFSSCSPTTNQGQVLSGTKKQSLNRDAWGHRPGPQGFTTVIIDAGHGGHDSGAIGHGLKEKALAMDTALRLKKKLSGKFKVVMLRGGDRFVDLNERVKFANRYSSAILVSLHYNSSRSSYVRGPETYYWRVDSHGLATRIQKNMEKVTGGRHTSLGKKRRRLRLTRNPQIPCVLVEFGYLSNAKDARLVRSASYRDRLASAVTSAIITQQKVGDAGTGRLPKPLYQPLSRPTDPPGS